MSAISDPNTGVRFISSSNGTGGTQSRAGRRHQPRGAGDERPAGRHPELRERPDLPGRDAAARLRRADAVPARQQRRTTDSYFRDVTCGNTANPTSGPDGDAAHQRLGRRHRMGRARTGSTSPPATRSALGATNLSPPASLVTNFSWGCAKTPSNSTERAFSCPSTTVCYAVGAASGGTPWYGKFLAGRRVGRREHVLQVHRRRADVVPVELRHVLDRVHVELDLHDGRRRRPRARDDRRRQHVDRRRDGAGQHQAAHADPVPVARRSATPWATAATR